MPLVKTPLANQFKDLFQGKSFPENETVAGQKWAGIYRAYTENAAAGPTLPVAPLLITAETTLATALASAFTTAKAAPVPSAIATLSAMLDVAFVSYWMSPPIAFSTLPITGVVSLAPPGVLTSLLTAFFIAGANQDKSASEQANDLSTVLDTWTKTVMVINTTPTGPLPPVPLT